MNDEPPTLEDVAEAVGVSTRTVSRVLRDEGGYSRETEDRVQAAVRELGYYPNLLARGLSGLRSGTVGLVAPNMTDPFFPELFDELQRVARTKGLKTFFASSFRDHDQQQEILGALRSYGVDGVIVFPIDDSGDAVAKFAASGTRTVVIDQQWSSPNLTSVSADIHDGARLAVQTLLDRGRRRIAMLDGSRPTSDSRRRQGYRDALPADHEPLIAASTPDVEGGRIATRQLLDQAPDLDGIVAYNDLMALAALDELASAGRTVPDDVSIVGYDDILPAHLSSPALTTVHYDLTTVATEALRLLEDLLDHRAPHPDPVLVPVRITQRQSV